MMTTRNTPVAITGIGAVTVAGPDAAALERGLVAEARSFAPPTRQHVDFEVNVAEARDEWYATHDHPQLSSPTGELCLTAAREAARCAGWSAAPDGLSLGTSTGGQSRNEEVVFALREGRKTPKFSYRRQGCMGAPTRLVARDLDVRGPVQTVSTACTSAAGAIALGAAWIRSGRAARVLAGGGDALCHTTVAGFHILDLTGPWFCRPFGADRPGLNLGDGAGFLCLEPLEDALEAGREPLAMLLGFGMSTDAHHMTAPPEDGAGAELALRRALDDAGLKANDVAHINAHGTGTALNDAAEAAAIDRVFGREIPVMSVKGLTGHTLGGAGAVEAVASVLAIRSGRAFANIGDRHAAEDCPVSLVPPGGVELPDAPVVISNSFAFGGNNCVLVFGAAEGGAR